ncbi:hypothetical protein HPP92_013459 [Vanilla planifolia]|uniref:Uncharacterized protein n=1 Tax=Vanilla planifolia TaxID=51239 RepID=A0A835QVM3_VANPL|nr:hypothetical protein HPP92_013901 [Vanilla planifolia]KAG0478740.1 hypothetical protein HPP92_013459 [Vanilla planifolia]
MSEQRFVSLTRVLPVPMEVQQRERGGKGNPYPIRGRVMKEITKDVLRGLGYKQDAGDQREKGDGGAGDGRHGSAGKGGNS